MTQRKWGTGLMYIAPSPTTAEVYALGRGRTAPSRDLIATQCLNNRMYAALWKQVASARAGLGALARDVSSGRILVTPSRYASGQACHHQ